jgi:hypothetical protein
MDFAGTNQLTIAANCVDWITSVAYDKNEKEFNTRYVGRFIKYIARDKHGREHIFFTKGTMLPPAIIPSLRHIDNSFQYAAYVLDSNIGADLSEIQGFLDLWNFLDAQHIERDLPLSGLRAIMSLIRSLPNKTDRSADGIDSVDIMSTGDAVQFAINEAEQPYATSYAATLITYCLIACCAARLEVASFPKLIERMRTTQNLATETKRDAHTLSHIILWAASEGILASYEKDPTRRAERQNRAREVYFSVFPRELQYRSTVESDYLFSPVLIIVGAYAGDPTGTYIGLETLKLFTQKRGVKCELLVNKVMTRYLSFFGSLIFGSASQSGFSPSDVKYMPMVAAFWLNILRCFNRELSREIIKIRQQVMGDEFTKEQTVMQFELSRS